VIVLGRPFQHSVKFAGKVGRGVTPTWELMKGAPLGQAPVLLANITLS
jgi:hypothetical protein